MGAQVPPGVGASDHSGAPINEEDRALFVEFLVSARRRSGRSLDEITTITKVPARHLEALEHGRVEALPGGVYRRAIVRNYARAVGLDPAVALERFAQLCGAEAVLPEFHGIPGVPSTPQRTEVVRQAIALAPLAAAKLRSFPPIASAARLFPSRLRVREHLRPLAIAAIIGVGLGIAAQVFFDWTRVSDRAAPAAAALPGIATRTAPDSSTTPSAGSMRSVPVAPPLVTPSTRETGAAPATGAVVPTTLDVADQPQPQSTVGPGTAVAEARLVITSRPTGARVTVNGIGWGVTPITVRHLEPGAKVVRVTMDGYLGQERLVRVGSQGGTHSVNLTLRERD